MSINLIKPTRLTTCFKYFFSVRVVFCLKFITITQVQRDLVRVRSRVNAATLRYDRRRETKLININVNIDKEYQFEILKKYINFIYPLLKQQCKN